MQPDPLAAFPDFLASVRQRLDAGRVAYGDRSFSAEPAALLTELQQECLDLAGWGFVLFQRLESAQRALAAAGHEPSGYDGIAARAWTEGYALGRRDAAIGAVNSRDTTPAPPIEVA